MPGDDDYYMKLKQMGNAEFVFIPHTQIPEEYAQADLLVNCSPTGGLDKAVLEAMAAGCIVLVANKAFAPYLPPECLFEYGNVKDLSEKIKAIDSLSPQEKSILSNKLVTSVTEYHSLSTTIAKILAT